MRAFCPIKSEEKKKTRPGFDPTSRQQTSSKYKSNDLQAEELLLSSDGEKKAPDCFVWLYEKPNNQPDSEVCVLCQ